MQGQSGSVICKMFSKEQHDAAQREHFFYTKVSPELLNQWVPGLIAHATHPESGTQILFLEDLHRYQAIGISKDPAVLQSVISIVARLHGAYWGSPDAHPILSTKRDNHLSLFDLSSEKHLQRYAVKLQQAWVPFQKECRSFCSTEEYLWMHKLVVHWYTLASQRYKQGNRTWIHADLHVFGNILRSNTQRNRDVYIIDWESIMISFGAQDIAYLLTAFAEKENKLALDQWFLAEYHQSLMSCGVENYSREQLNMDYRLGILNNLACTILQQNVSWLQKHLRSARLWKAAELLSTLHTTT